MKSIFKILTTLLFLIFSIITTAQIAVNTDGSAPDATAMLDITSTTKGILIPRMSTSDRTGISSPATGLLVFDTDYNSFWYHNGTAWTEIGESTGAFTSNNGITTSSNNDDDFVFGADSLNHGAGTEYKMFFNKNNGAFRVGGISNTNWDEDSIGISSIAFGSSSKASGVFSTAFGLETEASGFHSTAFGYVTAASGGLSTSFGLGTEAFSYSETAIGLFNTTYTPNNASDIDTDDRLFVIGNGTSTSNRSDAMVVYKNGNTEINGDLIVSGTLTGGAFSSENGITTSSNNDDDFVFGADSLNYGTGSEYKFFFDKGTRAIRGGQVDGNYWDTDSLGISSLGIGQNAVASGKYSIALGRNNRATAINSVAIGRYTEAPSYVETAIGTYNTIYTPNNTNGINSDDRLFVIGNGTSATRSDAMIVYKDGDTEINGDLALTGDLDLSTISNTAGDIQINDNLEVTGDLEISTINSSNNNLSIKGNTEIDADLEVIGDLEVSNDLEVTGTLTIGSLDISTISNSNGDFQINDNLAVTGALDITTIKNTSGTLQVNDDLEVTGDLDVTGDLTLMDNLNVDAINSSGTLDISSDVVVDGYLEITGDLEITTINSSNNDLLIEGNTTIDANLDVTGDLDVPTIKNANGTLQIDDDLEITGDLDISTINNSNSDVQINDNLDVTGDLDVTGNLDVATIENAGGTLQIDDDLEITGSLDISTISNSNSDVQINDNLDVTGTLEVTGNLDVATIENAGGTLEIDDDLDVTGDLDITGNLDIETINSSGGILSITDGISVDAESNISSATSGVSDYVLTVENTTDANGSLNNGILVKAGHSSYGTNSSLLIDFASPSGNNCGSIRQIGSTAISFVTTSDIRLKENIQPTTYGLQDILKINVRDYNYKTDKTTNQKTGFIAQQLHTVFPMAVFEGGEDEKTNPWTVDYASLTPLLVKGMQEQQEQIEALKIENGELANNDKAQQTEIEKLKAQVAEINDLKTMLLKMQAQLDANTNSN